MRIDKKELQPDDIKIFSELFDTVVWYSPVVEERIETPNYKSEEDVMSAVKHAARRLKGT